MSGRYFITGVQLGILIRCDSEKERAALLQEIMDEQFIGNEGDGNS